jgi:hypothetical protein
MDIPSSWFHITIVGLLVVILYFVWPRKSGFAAGGAESRQVRCELTQDGEGVTGRPCDDGYPCPRGDICYINYYTGKGECARLS